MHALHAKGFTIKGIRNGIRVKLGTGTDIDFYTLRVDPEQVRGRVKLDITDEKARAAAVCDIDARIRQGLDGTAEIDEFRLSRYNKGFFQYYARLFILEIKDSEEGNPGSVDLMTVPKERVIVEPMGLDLKKAVDLLEKIDSRKFRQALDELGLSRSSILRVSLTRIFRAAVDTDELEIALREEAERITDPRDRSDLERIRASNTTGFLGPLIALLHQSAGGDSCPELRITL